MLGGRTDYKGLIIRLDLVVDRNLVDFPGRPRC